MAKQFQNRVAESGLILPITAGITFMVWLLCGLIAHGWWGQLLCFIATTYLMVELSNSNALLRIRSRMVSCTFLVLSCTSCFTFGSMPAAFTQLCFVAATTFLFRLYQDNQSPGRTFYAFACIGLSSFSFVQIFYLVPLIWIVMASQLQAFSMRTWLASLLGLACPYWFAMVYYFYVQDFTALALHFDPLLSLPVPHGYSLLTFSHIAAFLLVIILMTTGIIHFLMHGYEDKIRIRQLYSYYIMISFVLVLFLILQPQHYDIYMGLLIATASPLIAHYMTLTHTKTSNIIFIVSILLSFLLVIYHFVSPYLNAWTGS